MKEKEDTRPHRFSGGKMQIGNRIWVNGRGPSKARCLVLGLAPTYKETVHGKAFLQKSQTGEVFNSQADFLYSHFANVGWPKGETYFTYVVKYALKRGEEPRAATIKECSLFLEEEITAVDPDIVVCLGALPFERMYGAQCYFDITRGEVLRRNIAGRERALLGVFSLDQVEKHPEYDDAFDRDLKEAVNFLKGTPRKIPDVDTMVFTHPEELASFTDTLFEVNRNPTLFVDSEWGGKHWQDPNRYFRTVQFSYARDKAVVLHLAHEGGVKTGNYDGMMQELKRLFEDPRVSIVGHNVIADGEWLLSFGIDIRPNVVYDTMLAEHILKNIGPFGLDDLSMKYTDFGRYCVDSDIWAKEHAASVKENGYGDMPDEILLPYGAYDVCVLDHIMDRQLPLLQERGALEPRGVRGEYPSLLHTVMATQRSLFEMETTGIPFDTERFKELVDAYQNIKADAYGKLTTACANIGMPDVNVNSSNDLRKLLYDKCGLTPIKATNKKAWSDAMANMAMDDDSGSIVASTDKDSLTMLEHAHPIVGLLLKYRRVSKPCDLFQMPDENGKGGLMQYVWPDGRIHTRYSQLLATGRLSSSQPNCFPADVEVLTDSGWMHWDVLYSHPERSSILLAQWDKETREITFEKPVGYVTFENAECIRNYTDQQIDIVSTRDHRFTVYNRKDTSKCKTVTADALFDCCDWLLPQAGRLTKIGARISQAQVSLICALQADGSIVKNGGVRFAFSKERKIKRLESVLNELHIKYTRDTRTYTGKRKDVTGFYIGKHDVPSWLYGKKFFGKWLLEYDDETLRMFEREVWFWDGCSGRMSMFASNSEQNAGWVQILCLCAGRRGKVRKYISNGGSVSWQVDAVTGWRSHLANLHVEDVGRKTVYCAKMPKDTVIVRYNGKVSFTNQCQNFSKKADSAMVEVFAPDPPPPSMRSFVKPPDGWVMMETDYSTAELHVLGNLSGDPNLLRALHTLGTDMHTMVAIDSFHLHMFDESGKEWTEDEICKYAAELGSDECDEFVNFQKHLTYKNEHGLCLTHSQMKNGPRLAAKTTNFSIMYGIGAAALALRIKSTTKDERPLDAITAEMQGVLDAWKTKSFPVAWQTLENWKRKVYEQGYIDNAWGMRKWTPIRPGDRNAAYEREAANFCIQSLVSGTIQIATERLLNRRKELGLHFRLQNQIHDALMLEVPKDEIDVTKEAMHWAMSEIDIPIYNTSKTFRLDSDTDLYSRWGEKLK